MDKKKAFDSSTQWISDEQRIHETTDYGRNKQAVNDALSEQQRRVKLVKEYSKEVEKVKASTKSTTLKEKVAAEYDELKDVAEHRQNCLQDIAQIASLEDIFNTLSIEFAQRATSLVVDACSEVTPPSSASGEEPKTGSDGIARAAQSCILAVRNNWNWISKLVKCSDVHLKHVSDYHQFFHEAKEYEQWMPAELNKHITNVEALNPEENGGQRLLMTLKETLAVFLHWQNKINTLFEKSRKIVPVHFRTKPLDHYRPITSLCDYKTNEISIQEGEELTLIDNSKPQIWMVRNMHAKESQVPSVICVIPGPDPDAVTMATRLRLQLLKTWTVCVKNIGRIVILFFGFVFKDLDDKSSKKLRSMTDGDKMRIIQVIQWITDIFGKYWMEDPQYKDMLTRINSTRTVVKENGNPKDYDSAFSKEYITRIMTIEELLTHFRNYLKQWETYKLLSETSRHSDYMLLVENWEQLKYFNTEDVLRKVNLGLEMNESYGSFGSGSSSSTVVTTTVKTDVMDGDETMSTMIVQESVQEVGSAVETETVESTSETVQEETVTTIQTVHQTAETEQYLHAEQEERKKFIITEPDLRLNLENGSSNPDVSNLSPRQPGDGTDAQDDDHFDGNGFRKHSQGKVGQDPPKNTEAYLDQRLVKRMTSDGSQERKLTEMTRTFLQRKLQSSVERKDGNMKQSGIPKVATSQSRKDDYVESKGDSSLLILTSSTDSQSKTEYKDVRPKTSSKIPKITSSSHKKSLNTPPSPSKIPRFRSTEYLYQRQGSQSTSDTGDDFLKNKSLSLDELGPGYDQSQVSGSWNGGNLEISQSNTDIHVSENQFDSGFGQSISGTTGRFGFGSKKLTQSDSSLNRNVLIYTEQTECIVDGSRIPVKIPEVPKVEMCTVGTQYEGFEDGASGLIVGKTESESTDKGGVLLVAGGSSATTIGGHSESHSENESALLITDRTKEAHTTTVTNTTNITHVSSAESGQRTDGNGESNQGGGVVVIETTKTKEVGKSDVDGGSGVLVTTSKTKTESLRYRESKRHKQKAGKSDIIVKQGSDSEEEAFYLATAASDEYAAAAAAAYASSNADAGIRGSAMKLSKAAENIQMVKETSSTHTDELELLQEAINIITADPDIDDKTSEGKKALCLRICKACLPLQMLMLLLLGLACLLPMSEEEYSCALSNNFASSFQMMLKHRDGPPPT